MQSVWAEFLACDKKDGGQLKSNKNNYPGVKKKNQFNDNGRLTRRLKSNDHKFIVRK